jgi:hypothetical protein
MRSSSVHSTSSLSTHVPEEDVASQPRAEANTWLNQQQNVLAHSYTQGHSPEEASRATGIPEAQVADHFKHMDAAMQSMADQYGGPTGGVDTQHGRPPQIDTLGAQRFRFTGTDPYTPQTPSPSTLQRYSNPDSLPGPTRTSKDHETGQEFVHYGNLRAPLEKQGVIEAGRRHMAEGGQKPQKYLAALETRPEGPQVDVHPFKHGYQHPFLVDGQAESKEAETTLNSRNGVTVKVPENEGIVTLSGKSQSSATTMAHELGHAARYRMVDGRPVRPPEQPLENSDWFKHEEKAVVQKIENPVAVAHGEGVRDSYRDAGAYMSEGFSSVRPADPAVATQIQSAAPQLQNLTKALRPNDDVATRSNGRLINPVAQDRHEAGQTLSAKLQDNMGSAELNPNEWLDSDSEHE